MQDIEALTKRIILIGKGKILLDGDLVSLKRKYSEHKTITVEYQIDGSNNSLLNNIKGLSLIENIQGRAVIAVDIAVISVSSAIAELSKNLDVTDISVSSASAEEMVVSLYKEHNI